MEGDQIVIACSAVVSWVERLLAIVASYFLESGIDSNHLEILLAENCEIKTDEFRELLIGYLMLARLSLQMHYMSITSTSRMVHSKRMIWLI